VISEGKTPRATRGEGRSQYFHQRGYWIIPGKKPKGEWDTSKKVGKKHVPAIGRLVSRVIVLKYYTEENEGEAFVQGAKKKGC